MLRRTKGGNSKNSRTTKKNNNNNNNKIETVAVTRMRNKIRIVTEEN